MRRIAVVVVALTATTAPTLAQAPPAGWKTGTDTRKACQISYPADWTFNIGTATAPDKKITATVHSMRAGQSFADSKTMVQSMMKPITVVQDDAKRLIYTMDPGPSGGANKNGWYVIANTTPVCTVSFTFATGADEKAMMKVADSLQLFK